VAAIASGIARSGADIIAIDGFRGGTGAAPTRIRDNVGIPIELALASVDQRLREEGIRDNVSIVVGGSIRNSSDVVKAVALGADCVYIGTAALIALGCHLCRSCHTGKCNWGIATQEPELVKRLNPDMGYKRLVNLVNAWKHEIKEMMGGMGINSIESLRGNRLMLRGVGLNEKELQILGIKHAGISSYPSSLTILKTLRTSEKMVPVFTTSTFIPIARASSAKAPVLKLISFTFICLPSSLTRERTWLFAPPTSPPPIK